MKKMLIGVSVAFAFVTAAFAGEAEGVIESVDVDAYMIKLSDGSDYTLPKEVDLSIIGEGMKVALAFDEVDGKKVVTDMEQVD